LGKIEAKFGLKYLNLGKIKILHPLKHPISYGYVDGLAHTSLVEASYDI